jgi:hypothetical protein
MENKNKKENVNIWQDVFTDTVAGIKAFSQCIAMSDLLNDGDSRLIISDSNCTLKVFKSNVLQNETKLNFTPVSTSSFYAHDANTRSLVPYLAVAGGTYIFIYKNLKGTFKFSIPNLEPNAQELQIWNDVKDGKIDYSTVIEKLQELYFNSIL